MLQQTSLRVKHIHIAEARSRYVVDSALLALGESDIELAVYPGHVEWRKPRRQSGIGEAAYEFEAAVEDLYPVVHKIRREQELVGSIESKALVHRA